MNDNHDAQCKKIKEAVCIDTSRVYDSCADKDCLADMRVYFTDAAQNAVDNATMVKCRGCDVINVFADVERVPFNRGYYSVDLTFYFMLTLDVFSKPTCQPETVCGLAMFSKKCILFGSDGNVKIFSSECSDKSHDDGASIISSNPRAKIQVAEPICLDAKICRPCDCCDNLADASCGIPTCIRKCFNGKFGPQSNEKAIRVTIGLFTIIQLERDVQMLIPAYDFCMPCKECACDAEDPCDAFRKIRFPVGEFFPPCEQEQLSANYDPSNDNCGCSK